MIECYQLYTSESVEELNSLEFAIINWWSYNKIFFVLLNQNMKKLT
jgi:hypothetical protein